MNEFENLLNQLSSITKSYNIIAKNSPNDYNIFRILNLQSDEVNLHSLFLAELLNPKGSHHKGDAFLESFISTAFPDSKNLVDLSTVQVEVERYIGPISHDESKGGRIDIIIEDANKTCIIIENKIYAGDQKKQLLRYYNYKGSNSGEILYLTIYGNEPSKISYCDLVSGEHFRTISYNNTIINWLILCHQIASDAPFLRETIQQYINLIKSLTGQTIFKEMYQDIKTVVLQNQQNLESAYHIAAEFEKIKIDLLIPFWEEVENQLCDRLKNEYKVIPNKSIKTNDNYPAIFVNEKKYFDLWYAQFAIEPLNGKSPWKPDNLYFGFWVNFEHKSVRENLDNLKKIFDRKTKNPNWWLDINDFQDISFSDIQTLKLILPNTNNRKDIQLKIVNTFADYIIKYKDLMDEIIQMIEPNYTV